jgi:hypothetical protein
MQRDGSGHRALGGVPRSVAWSLHSRLGCHEGYIQLARRRRAQNTIAVDTQLVIDGFMRTASTYAVVAFQLAQPRPVRVAHHLHAPAHLIAAARAGVPAMMTVREPSATCVSTAIRLPEIRMEAVLRAYVRFYRTLAPWRSAMVIAPFDRITADLGGVVREVNERFGTDFAAPAGTAVARADAFALIDDRARRPAWDAVIGRFLSGYAPRDEIDAMRARDDAVAEGPLPVTRVARPVDERDPLKSARSREYASAELESLRCQADEVFADLIRPITAFRS